MLVSEAHVNFCFTVFVNMLICL